VQHILLRLPVLNFSLDCVQYWLTELGNSADKLRHPRYSAEQVLVNKQQIWGGSACIHC